MIGQVFGKYRIVAPLGSGGMGAVWVGEHQVLGNRAAIKVLLPTLSEQTRMVERFFDEARAASRIQDPGIVAVIDSGWSENRAYIVMELLSGQTLTQRLGHDRMSVAQAVGIVQQCAIAMAAAHARGIIHRDLKPDNIHLVPDPAVRGGERIKILDFGIAKLIDDDGAHHGRTMTGVIMGTPAYMSPEQCRGAGSVDHRTDIYALGCVLFHLLCGRPPFIAPTPGDMIASHLTQQPPVPSQLVAGLPPQVDAMVRRCLAKDPDQRFATMTELARAGSLITGENMAVPTIPPLREGERRGSATVATTGPSTPPPRSRGSEGHVVRGPVVDTTLGGGAGEASLAPASRRRALWIIPAILGVGVAVLAVVLKAKDGPGASPAGGDGTTEPTHAIPMTTDAALPPPDAPRAGAAPSDAAPRDAGSRGHPPADAAPAIRHGAGSASMPPDPYKDR